MRRVGGRPTSSSSARRRARRTSRAARDAVHARAARPAPARCVRRGLSDDVRILEDDLHAPPQRAQRALAPPRDVLAVEAHAPGIGLDQAQQAAREPSTCRSPIRRRGRAASLAARENETSSSARTVTRRREQASRAHLEGLGEAARPRAGSARPRSRRPAPSSAPVRPARRQRHRAAARSAQLRRSRSGQRGAKRQPAGIADRRHLARDRRRAPRRSRSTRGIAASSASRVGMRRRREELVRPARSRRSRRRTSRRRGRRSARRRRGCA